MSAALIKMAEDRLAEVNKEIEAKVGSLATERDELTVALKKLTRGSKGPNEAPATSDEELVSTVGKLTSAPGSSPVGSKEVAAALGVDVRTISRRLAKHATDGNISGDKVDGYTAVA
jgi:hypothetical protein